MHLSKVNNLCFFAVSLPQYLTKFQWDLAKYPIKQSLKNISDIISKVNSVCIRVFSVVMFYYVLFLTALS